MNWRVMICMVGTLLLAGCGVLTVTPPSEPDAVPASTAPGSPPAEPNGWAGRSAGKGRVLKCGGEDPEADFWPSMVGAGKNAEVVDGVITFTSIYGFPLKEEISFPVRRPANYMDDPRCVGADGTRGLWMSITPEQSLSFFILPGDRRDVQVNQLILK